MKKNNLVFLSHLYNADTPSYGNRDMVKITSSSSIGEGMTNNSSCWIFTNNHIGTHIDVPFHFNNQGKKIEDYLAHEWFFSNVGVVDVPCHEAILISPNDLSHIKIDKEIDLLIIKTGFEFYRGSDHYWKNNPGLAPELASYLRHKYPKLRCIGFDFISITSWEHRDLGKDSHMEFLFPPKDAIPILAIEDMSLKEITNKINWVIVAPIRVTDGNGGPVTIIANLDTNHEE